MSSNWVEQNVGRYLIRKRLVIESTVTRICDDNCNKLNRFQLNFRYLIASGNTFVVSLVYKKITYDFGSNTNSHFFHGIIHIRKIPPKNWCLGRFLRENLSWEIYLELLQNIMYSLKLEIVENNYFPTSFLLLSTL